MCDCVSSTALLLPYSRIGSPDSRFSSRSSCIPRIGCTPRILTRESDCRTSRNCSSQLISACFRWNEAETNAAKSTNSLKISRNSVPTASSEYDFDGELGFKQRGKDQIDLKTGQFDKPGKQKLKRENGRSNDGKASSGVDFIQFDGGSGAKTTGRLEDNDFARTEEEEEDEEGCDGVGSKLEELEQRNVGPITATRGRQLMKRSNMLAKQVISIQSALSLGFISQLWVDTTAWVVLVVEVRPNLLSGEFERFFLEDVNQVGDVVLIQDECVMEIDFNMVGLETLVGYNVVTAGRQSIGKVRGYTFNVNSGAVESLELDSVGVSILPSSLVSTYALLVEDVLEVVSDTVVVHEGAASRIQRLTKGFWGSQKLGKSIDELGDYSDLESPPIKVDRGGSRRRSFAGRKFRPKMGESADNWELPMDYL